MTSTGGLPRLEMENENQNDQADTAYKPSAIPPFLAP